MAVAAGFAAQGWCPGFEVKGSCRGFGFTGLHVHSNPLYPFAAPSNKGAQITKGVRTILIKQTLGIKLAQKPYVVWSLGPKALIYEPLDPYTPYRSL